jgi:aspartate/methionine/tyrosine aminotransferase
MFSSRLTWDLQPNPISRLLSAKRADGVEILDLTESNPTHAQLALPEQAIVEAFATRDILRYDPNPAGMLLAREAVCSYYGDVDPDRVLLTTSTSEAYGYLFKLLTDPGDEILVPRPSYPLFDFLAGMELVSVRHYSLVYHGQWEIDFDSVRKQTSKRTRAIVIVNPNNPTGSFLHTWELGPLIEHCREHDIAILSDEVFADYGHGAGSDRVHSLCLSGLSKIAGLPQMKLGWIVAGGPEPWRREAMSRLELISDTYLSVGTPVQAAAARLLDLGRQVRDQIRERTARNLNALPFQVLNVEGGWYATWQAPRVRSEEEWVLQLLDRENVLVQPGFFYDFESEAFLVLSLLTPPAIFDEGIARIQSPLNGHVSWGSHW